MGRTCLSLTITLFYELEKFETNTQITANEDLKNILLVSRLAILIMTISLERYTKCSCCTHSFTFLVIDY